MHSTNLSRLVLAALLCGVFQAGCSGADDEPLTEEPLTEEKGTFPTEAGPAPKQDPTPPSSDAGPPSDSAPQPTSGSCAANGARVTEIEDNHTAIPHKMNDLPAADFKDPQGDRRYNLSPGGGQQGQTHTHTLTLSGGQRAELAKTGKLTKSSSGQNGNVHAITLTCK